VERALLRESVERFVSRSYGIEERNALVRGTPGYSSAHWATFAELGWLAILIPESLGGIGAAFADAAPLLEAFGAGLLLEPFTANAVLAGTLLAEAGTPAAAVVLEALGEGRALVATAYRDDAVRVVRTGDGLIVDGTATGVPFAAAAAQLIVSARDEDGATVLLLVERERPGIAIDERVALDGSRAARIVFRGVRVGDDAPLPFADAGAALGRALDLADAALCSEAAGVMARAYRDTAAHVRERVQFGKPIAAFQVVRHRIADMFVELELARAAAAFAAGAAEMDDTARARRVSMAKIQIIRSGRFVCEGAVQLHGAIGIAAEHASAHALARINGIASTFGDLVFHRRRYLSLPPEGTTL
jgi:alkylation response protein AidB-like acyl-CoA dehydrogenase